VATDHQIDRYLSLLSDRNELIRSSRGIIRRKHSPLARRVGEGRISAIIRAARDRINGTLTSGQKDQLCALLCELKRKISQRGPNVRVREYAAWFISSIVGLLDASGGILISLLWMLRSELEKWICPCKLDFSCFGGKCSAAV